MKRKTFLLICAVLIAALLIGVLAACDPGSKEQGGTQTPGGTQLPGNGGGGSTQTPGDNDQDDEQGGEVIEPAKLIFEKTDAGYSVTGYEGTPTVVVIPETYEGLPVTSIGWGAFDNCDSLTSVTIPDSVKSIGDFAFESCNSLTSIVIPDSVKSIGSGAFAWCTSLTSITIGNSVTSIGEYAFYLCTSLTSITIPDSVTSIGNSAFSGCTSLASVAIPDSVTSIELAAFAHCSSLERLTVAPGNPVYRSAGNCIIETETGTLIQGCNNSVIPTDGSVKSIGGMAFVGCTSLTSVTIPDSVESIGGMAFVGCTSLERLTVAPGNPVYHSAGNCIIEIETGTLIQGCNNSVIPSDGSVTSIGADAFRGCISLTSIIISDSVTSIGAYAFEDCTSLTFVALGNGVTSIGDYAFLDCRKLIEVYNKSSLDITVGSSDHGEVACYAKHVYTEEGGSWLTDTEDGFRFFYDGKTGYLVTYLGNETELTLPESFTAYDRTEVTSYKIYDYAFYGRNDLTSVTIPDSVTGIGSHAFDGCRAEIIWGGTPSITKIGDSAFAGYAGTSITIPDSVTSIGSHAFYGCDSLTSVTIGNSVTSIGEYAFYNCDSLTSVAIGNGVTSIGEDAFRNCDSLTSVTIGNSVTSIGRHAFNDCDFLETLTVAPGNPKYHSAGNCIIETATKTLVVGCKSSVIPDDGSVTSIGEYAFFSCDSLTSVTIPDGVTSIGGSAFFSCDSLTSIVIPDSVTSIEDSAFAWCTSLTSVTIPDSVTSIGSGAFRDCYSLTSVTIGNGVTSIGDFAFGYCDSLTSVTIGNSVTSIGNYAFYNCNSLTSIVIPDSVTSIGNYAFRGCSSLTPVTFEGTMAEWNAVEKANDWAQECPLLTEVKCSDGTVSV